MCLSKRRTWPGRKNHGFSLVEISVVVTLIGLLAAIGMPAYRRIQLKSRATAAVNDFRAFSGACVTYNMQQASWPAGGLNPGEAPPELVGVLPAAFSKPTPIGGYYEWISNSSYKAAIRVSTYNGNNATDDADLVEMIDRIMDDGNLSTGSVRVESGSVIYIIEP